MPKADLRPCRTPDEAKERGRNGGLASGAARRRKRDLREHMRALLDGERDGMSGAESLALAMYEKAMSGDVRAFEAVLAVSGQGARQTLPEIELPEARNKSEWPNVTRAVLEAVTSGRISLDEAQRILTLAGEHMKAVMDAAYSQKVKETFGGLFADDE